MRITRLLPALAVALLLFSPRNAGAQGGLPAAGAPPASVPVVEIRGVREATFDNWILADGVWRMKWPCLKVTLRTNENVKKDAVVGRAYFFDKDKKLVSELKNLPNAHHADGSYGLPPLLKARENIEAYVPIETVTKEAKWRVAVLVFGHRSKLTAEVYPRRGLEGLRVPGKRSAPRTAQAGRGGKEEQDQFAAAPASDGTAAVGNEGGLR